MNHDFSDMGLDDPITDELIVFGVRASGASCRTCRAHRRRHHAAGTSPATGPRCRGPALSAPATGWLTRSSGSTAAPDGSPSSPPPYTPGAYEDMVRLVVPEAPAPRLFHRVFGSTLRHLGIAPP